jgi:hypothetical protein
VTVSRNWTPLANDQTTRYTHSPVSLCASTTFRPSFFAQHPGNRPAHGVRLAVKNRQQIIQRLIHSPKVTDVAPMDGVRIVAEMVVGQLLQGLDFVECHRQALEVSVEGCGLGGLGGLQVDG